MQAEGRHRNFEDLMNFGINNDHCSRIKPKIGLFGYYSYDNWGDNLMALIFYSYLKQQYASFSVFIKNSKKAYFAGFIKNTADTIEEFLVDKDFIVYGGGGILVPAKHEPATFSKDLTELVETCQKKRIPIYGISIGGIGNPHTEFHQHSRRKLFEFIKFATVRNPQDLLLLKQFGKKGTFFHDILWLTPDFFEIKERRKKTLTIAINFQTIKGGFTEQIYWKIFRLCLYQLVKRRPDFEFIFFDTMINSDKNKEFSSMRAFHNYKNTQEYKFSDPVKDLGAINKCSIILSDKLHLGLVGMALGKPFISVKGKPKTKLMLSNIGLSSSYFGKYRAFLLPILILSEGFLLKRVKNFEILNRNKMIQSARGNLTELANIISKYAKNNDSREEE